MSSLIVFQPKGGIVCAMSVAANCGIPIEQIGIKDVPDGTPFWIVDAENYASLDQATREAWVLDTKVLGSPAGIGTAK